MVIAASALFALGGCYHAGYTYDDSSYRTQEPDLSFSPPTITFYRDDSEVPFYYEEEAYPFYSYYPYLPYNPPEFGNPFYQYYH